MSHAIQPEPPAPTVPAPSEEARSRPRATPAATAEVRETSLMVAGALVIGLVGQIWLPPSPEVMVFGTLIGAVGLLVAASLGSGRLKDTLHGFRFTATVLFAISLVAALGTLVLQGKPAEFYVARYGGVGSVINALRLDDVFHSLPFALIMAMFVAGIAHSSFRRLPVTRRNAGFHLAHMGLLLSLAGAAVSALFSVHAFVNVEEGTSVTEVQVTKGSDTGEWVPLGFSLHLEDFGLDTYQSEHRLRFFQQDLEGRWSLKASWDPTTGEARRLPDGASYEVLAYYPDLVVGQKLVPDPAGGEPRIVPDYSTRSQRANNPAAQIRVHHPGGRVEEQLLVADRSGAVRVAGGALAFQKQSDEVKTYRSQVTATGENEIRQALITVNEPLVFGGWTLYQSSYDPNSMKVSGFQVVRDPGVPWVFAGFGLIGLGVVYMFHIAPRLRRSNKSRA